MLVETGIGDRISDKGRAMRGYEGPWIVPALESAGFDPASVDAVAVSHLHFDHAGGVLQADGALAFPRASFVAQLAEWEIAMGDNPRLVAATTSRSCGWYAIWGWAASWRARLRYCPA